MSCVTVLLCYCHCVIMVMSCRWQGSSSARGIPLPEGYLGVIMFGCRAWAGHVEYQYHVLASGGRRPIKNVRTRCCQRNSTITATIYDRLLHYLYTSVQGSSRQAHRPAQSPACCLPGRTHASCSMAPHSRHPAGTTQQSPRPHMPGPRQLSLCRGNLPKRHYINQLHNHYIVTY